MKKTWQERIDAARERGHFTKKDELDMYSWDACFVGEALAEIGVAVEEAFVGNEAETLIALGGGNQSHWWTTFYHHAMKKPVVHPVFLVLEDDFAAAEARLHAIHDAIDKLYPPPKVEISALSPKKEKAVNKQKHEKATVVP